MKIASINEIKSCLNDMEKEELISGLLRLVKFKNDNKQLLNFILFEEQNPEQYILQIKAEIDLAFDSLNGSQFYLAKKTIRKTIRIANKHIKFCSKDFVEVEVLLYVCQKIKDCPYDVEKFSVLKTIFQGLTKKIEKALSTMHADLQYDYQKQYASILG